MAASDTKLCEVVHIKRSGGEVVQWCDVYIGRACYMGGWKLPKSVWANPYTLKQYGKEAITKYYYYVKNNPDLMNKLDELRGKVLGCWCDIDYKKQLLERLNNPSCHGEVLMRLLYEKSISKV